MRKKIFKRNKIKSKKAMILYIVFLVFLSAIAIFISTIKNNLTLKTQASQTSRIYGGQDASIDDWPNVVLLFSYHEATKFNKKVPSAKNMYDAKLINNSRLCTGSLIDKNWVLTAAHCIKNANDPNIAIATGFDDFGNQKINFNEGRYVFKPSAKDIFVHKDYKVVPQKDGKVMAFADLALIRVNYLYNFDLKPMPVAKRLNYSSKAYVIGWGFSHNDANGNPQMSDKLQQLELRLTKKGFQYYLTDAFYNTQFNDKVLTNYLNPGQLIAAGDSGAPLMVFDAKSKTYHQLGVNTSGLAITDLTKYIGWIEDTTGLDF